MELGIVRESEDDDANPVPDEQKLGDAADAA